MNFQEINTRLKTRDIKGKPYVEVNQRVLAFREVYPTGCIASECVSDDGQRCMFRATIYDGEGKILATGHAFEVRNAGTVNKTSYIENCVPLDTQILTAEGWRYFYQAKPGCKVWSFNMETGKNEFTTLERVNVYRDRPLVKLANSRFRFVCTPQHKWIVRDQSRRLGKCETQNLKAHHKIVTAINSDVTPSTIGKKLGWLMCDSEMTRTSDGMPSTAYIRQAKHVKEVSALFGEGTLVKKHKTHWRDCYEWVVKADEVREILGAFGIGGYGDLVGAMASAKLADVAGCYESMMLADGTSSGFSSTYKELVEAVQIMCARLGIATNRITSRMCKKSTKPIYTLPIKCTDGAWFTEIEVTNLPPNDVWCPTTKNGTWCARQNGFVTMTSNCETSAVGRALGFLGIGITEAIASAEEVENAITQQEADAEPTDRESGVMSAKRALTDVLRRYAELTGKDFSELVTFEKGSKDYRDTQAYLFGRVRYYDAEIQRAMENVE